MAIHPSVTVERALELAEDDMDNPGICIACGEDAYGCEPDMRRGECECCGERKVYGAAELVLMLA